MYCFRCGRKLPGREINCPDCDTPQKKRRRRHRRMVLGLFIFLAGAFTGSLFDTYLFKGEAWKHSFLSEFFSNLKGENNPSNATSTGVTVEMKYSNSVAPSTSDTSTTSTETGKSEDLEKVKEALFPSEQNYNSSDDKSSMANDSKPDDTTVSEVVSPASEIKDELKPIENIPTEIANVLASSPEVVPSGFSIVSDNVNINNEVTIIEGKESDFEISQDATASEASETAPLFTEAAPIQESETPVEPTPVVEQHLIYKNLSLLEASSGDSYHAFMARDGKELLFASNRYDYNGKPTFQCFAKSPSEKVKSERVFEWQGNVWTPELTPDGNMIIFSSDSVQKEHIFLYDRKSGNSMALTSGNTKNMMPCISPDGKRIVFVSNRGDGKNRIWMLEIFNKNKLTQLTKGAVNDCEPRWTPDGKSVVFTRIISAKKISHIMKVDVDPVGEPVAIVSADSRNWMADVSPDNKYIAYTRSLGTNGSKNAIVLQDLSSGQEEVMNFSGISECKRPVWNADGSGFVFHANSKNIKNLYQANFVRE